MTDGSTYSGEEPVIRDKRRIDPVTGQVRQPPADAGPAPEAGPATVPAAEATTAGDGAPAPDRPEAGVLRAQLAERTADLQRLQAEYANYRRRVERDRQAVRELAVVGVLSELLPVLDDIGRAREHGELEGGFRSVAESLEATVSKLGLQRFGEAGEEFDPTVHEALLHSYSAEVEDATCVAILRPGYRVGDRIIRPAQVAVAEPDPVVQAEVPGADDRSGGPDDN